jgi:hypothetical protein
MDKITAQKVFSLCKKNNFFARIDGLNRVQIITNNFVGSDHTNLDEIIAKFELRETNLHADKESDKTNGLNISILSR